MSGFNMQIKLQQLQPTYLEQEKLAGSEIWDSHHLFNEAEYIEITASSGRGKSSFIHFLYGLKKYFSGKIFINEKDASTFSLKETAAIRSRKLSIVFQDLRLFESATCLQNIQVKNALTGHSNLSDIERMADRLGIRNKLYAIAGNCSYGERQRVAIIRALQQPFEYILLDEPFSHLDEENRKKAITLILEEVSKQQAGMVLADLESNPSFPASRRLKL